MELENSERKPTVAMAANLQQWHFDSGSSEVTTLKGCDSRESLAAAHAASRWRQRLYHEDEDAESADLDAESIDGDAESADLYSISI